MVIVAFLLLFGCTQGKRPFLIVQLCLSNGAGVTEFIREMKSIAVLEKMEFLNNSANTKRNLEVLGYSGSERTNGSPVINIGVLRSDGLGVGGGNLGLPGYQVALGFSVGSDDAEAREFANRVIKRLGQHWHIEMVPSGQGDKPMSDCN